VNTVIALEATAACRWCIPGGAAAAGVAGAAEGAACPHLLLQVVTQVLQQLAGTHR